MVCSVPLVSHTAQVQNADAHLTHKKMCVAEGAAGPGGGGEPPDPNFIKQMFDQMSRRGRGWDTPGRTEPADNPAGPKRMKVGGWGLRPEDMEMIRQNTEKLSNIRCEAEEQRLMELAEEVHTDWIADEAWEAEADRLLAAGQLAAGHVEPGSAAWQANAARIAAAVAATSDAAAAQQAAAADAATLDAAGHAGAPFPEVHFGVDELPDDAWTGKTPGSKQTTNWNQKFKNTICLIFGLQTNHEA